MARGAGDGGERASAVGRGEKIEVLPFEGALEQTQHGLSVIDEKDERARNVHGRGEGQRRRLLSRFVAITRFRIDRGGLGPGGPAYRRMSTGGERIRRGLRQPTASGALVLGPRPPCSR